MRLVAALSAATAAWLLLAPPRRGLRALGSGPGTDAQGRSVRRAAPITAFGLVAAVLLATTDGTRLALASVVLGVAAAVALLVRRSRAARAAAERRGRVVEVCEALVGELRAGQPLVSSLAHCQEVWPDLAPVVAAARLDADVPAALRRLARRPGAEGLAEIASAWQVSRRSGSGLAGVLGQVAVTARARQGTQALVAGELASAQATARLVALLPLATLSMAAGVGGDPWHFLLGTPPGLACLALGAACAFGGLLWIDRIAASVLGERG